MNNTHLASVKIVNYPKPMKESVILHDKKFELLFSPEEINKLIDKIATRINNDINGRDTVFIAVLNGAFIFAADLIRKIGENAQITFLKLASYIDDHSTGEVRQLIGINNSLENKTIIILEDIIDSGNTLEYLKNELKKHKPLEIKVAALLFKPGACKRNVQIDYLGTEVPDRFLVGYGLDYNGLGRNLRGVYAEIP